MRVLLDECLPRKLKSDLPGHIVTTVPEMGWAGAKNGALLLLAAGAFDVFVTADQNVEYQQNLRATELAVVVLAAPNNRLDTRRALMPRVTAVLATIQAGDLVRVAA
jgi:predicted nuclease of predicted toxin-antitoxin system